jgi:hypothetical protein
MYLDLSTFVFLSSPFLSHSLPFFSVQHRASQSALMRSGTFLVLHVLHGPMCSLAPLKWDEEWMVCFNQKLLLFGLFLALCFLSAPDDRVLLLI